MTELVGIAQKRGKVMIMPGPCYYHPDTPSTANCVQCGVPICNADTEMIAGKPVCRNCVAVVRARVEREMASQPASAPGGATGNWPPPPAGQAVNYGNYYAPAVAVDPSKLAMGIVVSLVIGIICAVGIEKIENASHFSLLYLYVLMGYGIGWGLHRLTGEGSPKMAGIAVGVMVVSLVVSHLVLVQDAVNQVRTAPDGDPGVTFGDALVPVLSNLGIVHWAFIAFALFACFRGMMRRQ